MPWAATSLALLLLAGTDTPLADTESDVPRRATLRPSDPLNCEEDRSAPRAARALTDKTIDATLGDVNRLLAAKLESLLPLPERVWFRFGSLDELAELRALPPEVSRLVRASEAAELTAAGYGKGASPLTPAPPAPGSTAELAPPKPDEAAAALALSRHVSTWLARRVFTRSNLVSIDAKAARFALKPEVVCPGDSTARATCAKLLQATPIVFSVSPLTDQGFDIAVMVGRVEPPVALRLRSRCATLKGDLAAVKDLFPLLQAATGIALPDTLGAAEGGLELRLGTVGPSQQVGNLAILTPLRFSTVVKNREAPLELRLRPTGSIASVELFLSPSGLRGARVFVSPAALKSASGLIPAELNVVISHWLVQALGSFADALARAIGLILELFASLLALLLVGLVGNGP